MLGDEPVQLGPALELHHLPCRGLRQSLERKILVPDYKKYFKMTLNCLKVKRGKNVLCTLKQASEVRARLTLQEPSRKPICWLPASRREIGT